MVRAWARSAFPWLTWLYVASLLIQVFLAGLAIFNDPRRSTRTSTSAGSWLVS